MTVYTEYQKAQILKGALINFMRFYDSIQKTPAYNDFIPDLEKLEIKQEELFEMTSWLLHQFDIIFNTTSTNGTLSVFEDEKIILYKVNNEYIIISFSEFVKNNPTQTDNFVLGALGLFHLPYEIN
jgi:hypothetical protein